ncbi:MAG: NUDIX domain-containing protein [Nanoarchaeota archaeon]|nr:NUDIX domain-containing protein [Nanoarchaeota archaeon]
MKKGIDFIGITTVFLCHDGQGNILLSKRSNKCRDEHGRWDPGGGSLEYGQRVEDSLKREVKEEYGTDVLDFEFLGYRDVHRNENRIKSHWVALDFKVLVDKNKVKNCEPHKCEELKWFKLNNLPEPMHSQFTTFYELYKNKLNL